MNSTKDTLDKEIQYIPVGRYAAGEGPAGSSDSFIIGREVRT